MGIPKHFQLLRNFQMYLSKISRMLLKEPEVAFQIMAQQRERCAGQVGPASFSRVHILVNAKRTQSETRMVTILVNYRNTETSTFLSPTNDKAQGLLCFLSPAIYLILQ